LRIFRFQFVAAYSSLQWSLSVCLSAILHMTTSFSVVAVALSVTGACKAPIWRIGACVVTGNDTLWLRRDDQVSIERELYRSNVV